MYHNRITPNLQPDSTTRATGLEHVNSAAMDARLKRRAESEAMRFTMPPENEHRNMVTVEKRKLRGGETFRPGDGFAR